MSSGKSERSQYQTQAESHMREVKAHPEWMYLANQAIKPWNDGDVTLQHAISVALREAYEAGTRGDYPELPEPEARPTRIMRSRPDAHTTEVRIQRNRFARTKV